VKPAFSFYSTVLALCVALGGCAVKVPSDLITGSTPAAAKPPINSHAAAANSPLARAAQASAKKDDDWWKDGGVTREKINAMCWMKYEKGRRDISVDKRADLVDECVKETLKEHPLK
jgi:hypothetical protein